MAIDPDTAPSDAVAPSEAPSSAYAPRGAKLKDAEAPSDTSLDDESSSSGSIATDEEDVSDGVAPVSRRRTVSKRRMTGKVQQFEARRVRRLIRHIDPWSVMKLSIIFFLCLWIMFMIAALVTWSVADSAGTISNIEDLMDSLGFANWEFDANFIFRQYGLVGLILALGSVVGSVVATLVFNLVSDIIGGVWISVIEEETARPVDPS